MALHAHRRGSARWALAAVAAALLAALTVVLPGSAAATTTGPVHGPVDTALDPGCQLTDVPVPSSVVEHQVVPLPGAVALAPDLTIHGRLCMPAGAAPKTVMLALHGITYTNDYWNVDYQPDT